MKKLVSLALVLCMCLALLVGCSSGTENSSSESSVSSDTETSESFQSADTTESKTDTKKLPDGTVKNSIEAQAAKLKDGTAEAEVLSSEKIGDYLDISVYLNFAGYENKEGISEEFVSFAENVCKDFETDFAYASADFTLYVDEEYVASFAASFEDGYFTSPLGAVVLDETYQMIDARVRSSSYFTGSEGSSSLEGLAEYFNTDVTTDIVDGNAMIYIPVEEVTAENLYSVASIFFDEDRSSELYVEMEASRIFSNLDRYVFRVCTTDQEQILDFIYEYNSDTMLDFDTTMEYNDKYAKEIAEFSDMT